MAWHGMEPDIDSSISVELYTSKADLTFEMNMFQYDMCSPTYPQNIRLFPIPEMSLTSLIVPSS